MQHRLRFPRQPRWHTPVIKSFFLSYSRHSRHSRHSISSLTDTDGQTNRQTQSKLLCRTLKLYQPLPPPTHRYGYLAIHFSTFTTLQNYVYKQNWTSNRMDVGAMINSDNQPKTTPPSNNLRDRLLKREALRQINKKSTK